MRRQPANVARPDLQLLGDFGVGFTKIEQAYGLVFELLGVALIGFLVHGFWHVGFPIAPGPES